MGTFLDTITTIPTVVYTVLLGIVILYWCLGFLGAVDIFSHHDVDLDLDVDGAHIPHGHGHIDVDIDADADLDHDHDGGGHHGGMLSALGLAGVPVSIAFSLLVLFSWGFSALSSGWILPRVGTGLQIPVAIAVGVGALALAVPPAAVCVRPLRKLFTPHLAERRRELIGRMCTITTQRVTATFGQAEVGTGGAPHLVQVRCSRKNDLARGSTAVVSDYDADDEVFHIAPAEELGEDV